MAPNRGRNRAKEFENLLEATPKDLDPEIDDAPDDVSGSDVSSDDDREETARDHYVSVGKSKLRQRKATALGPQYRGSQVDRNAALDGASEEDDPFARGFDEQPSDDENASILDDGSSDAGSEEEEDDEEASMTDVSEDAQEAPDDGRAELRKLIAQEQKAVAANIQQANKDDAAKGRAVKKQRTAFDSLLNTRIKLQKALIGVNSIAAIATEDMDEQRRRVTDAMEAAEAAALNLWSTLNQFREDALSTRTGMKRKHSAFTSETSTHDLLSHLREQDDSSETVWKATLQKWSVKTRGATTLPARNRINNTEQPATILDVINEQLGQSERLIKRTHMPRSCAPVQAAKNITEDSAIYDDADFYGLLLKELLEQKSHESSAAAANIDLSFQLRRDNKTKKTVDTKASKGRKLRYTVHEKLQNFMAPEDRSTWGSRQTDELFGSLFGQRLALGEDVDAEMDDHGDDDDHAEEAGLLMFRK